MWNYFLKIIIFMLFTSVNIFAQSEDTDSLILDKITIHGLNRTKIFIVERELAIRSGDRISAKKLSQLKQNLLNLQLFSKVDITTQGPNNGAELIVSLEEKWTTIPILKFSSGGGTQQTILGVYDPNLGGRYLEAGLQFERLASEWSAVTWFKNPRFFDRKLLLDLQYWNINRLRIKYDPLENNSVETEGFIQKKEKIYFGLEPALTDNITGRILLEYNADSFSRDSLSDELKNKFSLIPLPEQDKVIFLGLGVDYGKLDWNNFLIDGHKASVDLKYGSVAGEPAENFLQTDLSYIFSKTISQNSTFAQRFLAGTTSANLIQYWNYLGGLDRIRGFKDNRFAGRYYFLSNSELRTPVIENANYVVQATTFLDWLSISEQLHEFNQLTAASAGVGLRLILPKIYRFTLRVDLAKPLKKSDDQFLSFGIQQFF